MRLVVINCEHNVFSVQECVPSLCILQDRRKTPSTSDFEIPDRVSLNSLLRTLASCCTIPLRLNTSQRLNVAPRKQFIQRISCLLAIFNLTLPSSPRTACTPKPAVPFQRPRIGANVRPTAVGLPIVKTIFPCSPIAL